MAPAALKRAPGLLFVPVCANTFPHALGGRNTSDLDSCALPDRIPALCVRFLCQHCSLPAIRHRRAGRRQHAR